MFIAKQCPGLMVNKEPKRTRISFFLLEQHICHSIRAFFPSEITKILFFNLEKKKRTLFYVLWCLKGINFVILIVIDLNISLYADDLFIPLDEENSYRI